MSGYADAAWAGERVGILGGTFDPPHRGHVRMAAVARDVLGLEHVVLSVAPHPPHKSGEPVTAWEHRHAMTQAATEGEPGLAATALESGPGPSYTVDLLRAASARTAADLYFILGADSLASFSSWREPETILTLCTLVVFPRDDHPARVPVAGPASVVVFESPRFGLSSSALRASLASGAVPAGALAPAVAAYIQRHGLYIISR